MADESESSYQEGGRQESLHVKLQLDLVIERLPDGGGEAVVAGIACNKPCNILIKIPVPPKGGGHRQVAGTVEATGEGGATSEGGAAPAS